LSMKCHHSCGASRFLVTSPPTWCLSNAPMAKSRTPTWNWRLKFWLSVPSSPRRRSLNGNRLVHFVTTPPPSAGSRRWPRSHCHLPPGGSSAVWRSCSTTITPVALPRCMYRARIIPWPTLPPDRRRHMPCSAAKRPPSLTTIFCLRLTACSHSPSRPSGPLPWYPFG
jgi:hypothetical protein